MNVQNGRHRVKYGPVTTNEIAEVISPCLIGTDIMSTLGLLRDYEKGRIMQSVDGIPYDMPTARAKGSGLLMIKLVDLNMFEERCKTRVSEYDGFTLERQAHVGIQYRYLNNVSHNRSIPQVPSHLSLHNLLFDSKSPHYVYRRNTMASQSAGNMDATSDPAKGAIPMEIDSGDAATSQTISGPIIVSLLAQTPLMANAALL